eukprot:CFRG8513T1
MLADLVNRDESGSKYSCRTPPTMRRLPRLGSASPPQTRCISTSAFVHESNELPLDRRSYRSDAPLIDNARETVEAEREDLCNWH